jgi:hypothetical protein
MQKSWFPGLLNVIEIWCAALNGDQPGMQLFCTTLRIKKVERFYIFYPLSYTVAGQRCAARLCVKFFAKVRVTGPVSFTGR